MPSEGNPIVFGHYKQPGATKTILVYGHYDVMPVEPCLLYTSHVRSHKGTVSIVVLEEWDERSSNRSDLRQAVPLLTPEAPIVGTGIERCV